MYNNKCHVLVILCLVKTGFAQDFGYDGIEGPKFWGKKYQQCVGKHQSPINIEEHNVEMVNLLPMSYENFDKRPTTATLTNNGHTVFTISNEFKPRITGGPLIGKYEFAQLHFHWGSNDDEGSENRINNSSYPMELHVVFFSSSYGSFLNATVHPDGLAVLSFLYSKSDEKNEKYNDLTEALANVVNVSTKTEMYKVPPLEDLFVSNRSTYFTYGGSLTTPPCSEVVTWIEFKNTIPLTHEQIQVFRQLNSEHGKLNHNFRPTQPLYGRVIRMNRDVNTYYKREIDSEHNSEKIINPSLKLLILALYFISGNRC